MARLYNRSASLTIARPTSGEFTLAPLPNAIEISGLSMSFKIEKSLEPGPNTCEVIVFNLAENTRAEFQRKPLHVILEAGYDDVTSRLFAGDMRWARSSREGPDWQTKILIGDGDRAYRHARMNRS